MQTIQPELQPEPDLQAVAARSLSQEDQARADLYGLIATLLLRRPDAGLLSALAAADSLDAQQSDSRLDQSWEALLLAASLISVTAVQEEFDALFISAGTPPVNPYASHYLAGFMMEKPLAALRDDLAALGLARAPGVGEPEDHLGALCEVMRILVAGHAGVARQAVQAQKAFFMTHLAPWHSRCLEDIRAADGANFYRHVASFSQAFFELEFQAFEMDESGEDTGRMDNHKE